MTEDQEGKTPQASSAIEELLLNLAVVIMGTISCYTTAVGIAPMLGNKVFAYFIAVALSLFMIVIALNIPKSPTRSRRRGSIFAYSIVALFSILLNFNAIYGVANADTLLYAEISTKRDSLVALGSTAIRDINEKYQVDFWQQEVDAGRQEMEMEKLTPGEEGCGPKCRAIYREKVLPSEGKLDAAKREANRFIPTVENLLGSIYPNPINEIIKNEDPKEMDEGIQQIINVYQNIAREIEPITGKRYPQLVYKDRRIGNLSHTVSTIFSYNEQEPQGRAAIFISLLLSFLIDFLILFVILFLSPAVPLEENPRYRQRRRGSGGGRPSFYRGDRSRSNTSRSKDTNRISDDDSPFVNRPSRK